jgi:hypothetical protein
MAGVDARWRVQLGRDLRDVQAARADPAFALDQKSQPAEGGRLLCRRNNGNVEITLAEYLTFVALCHQGCTDNTIDG